jgi:transposase-like protein
MVRALRAVRVPSEEACLAHLERVRWRGRPACPYCWSFQATPCPTEHRYHCNACHRTFSATVGTLFQHIHLPLQTWFRAIVLVLTAPRRVSARHLAEVLGVHKNTAWRLGRLIRQAMATPSQRPLLRSVVRFVERANSA